MTTKDKRYTREIKSKVAMAKTTLSYKKYLFTRKLDLNIRNKLRISSFGAYFGTVPKLKALRKVEQKHLESFEMWCRRRME